MIPIPPGSESTPSHEDDGVNTLLADIERILQQLRAYNKRPLPATEEQVKKLIQNEKERPIHVPAEKVVEQLMGKTEELVARFQSIYNEFITLLNSQTRALRQEMTTQVAAMQAAAAAVQASARAVQASAGEVGAAGEKLPRSISVEGEVFGFTNWKIAVGCLVGPVLFLLLIQASLGQFSKVSKEEYEQLQALNATIQAKSAMLRETNNLLDEENRFYLKHIGRYVAKNKKAAVDFPTWKRVE
jgi:hypothetical protein